MEEVQGVKWFVSQETEFISEATFIFHLYLKEDSSGRFISIVLEQICCIDVKSGTLLLWMRRGCVGWSVVWSWGQKNYDLVSGNAGDEKNLDPGGHKKPFLINLVEFFKYSLLLKNYSNSAFLYWKTKNPIFYFLKGEKRKFVRINLLVEFFLFVFVFFLHKKYILSKIYTLKYILSKG